ncbi:unnamed protein product [Sympodiomycopsis kandeliae]
MPAPNQTALVSAAVLAFAILLAGSKVVVKNYGPLPVLTDLDKATNIKDPQVAAAFAFGLVASLAVLVYSFASKPKPTLDPKVWQQFNLMEKKQISSNTALYRFRLPTSSSILGLPIGQHISLQAEINGKSVQRSYTPTSSDDDLGFFDLIVKTYPQGNISKYLDELKIGEQISVKGPKGQMRYHPELATRIGMIAGGTGFTPCLQIIRAALKNPSDTTKIDFIYANVTESDILLKDELDRLVRDYPDRFRILYFLNEPPPNFNGKKGFITKEAIQEFLPAPSKDIKILMCGPPPMINACKKHLDELGYEKPRAVSKMEDQVFSF